MERHEQIEMIVAKFFSERRDINPYASADTMRALDHVIRNGLADGLARAASVWRSIYQEQSRRVGVLTRDNPLPDAQQMADLREDKRLADMLSARVSAVHALPAPANDRVYHRIRNNDQLLELLITTDYGLAVLADSIDRLGDGVTRDTAAQSREAFEQKIAELDAALKERSRLLSSVP
ncbi:MAG: hypothetical protein C7B45_14445 [Sulfobacillus acidophilus]|uniref:Uncharacterized protein n=1 Tax=Sulfobacillus acidophilus TaxID=53633 RepID=A0A2T2WE72_9FIRM|nr:MAG: hypothetical protein C7B45_14445 [Sulfobacillus acidophilus]